MRGGEGEIYVREGVGLYEKQPLTASYVYKNESTKGGGGEAAIGERGK